VIIVCAIAGGPFPARANPHRIEARAPLAGLCRQLAIHGRREPLIIGDRTCGRGWATGGGAAPDPLHALWRGGSITAVRWHRDDLGAAGVGLVVGGIVGHQLGHRCRLNGQARGRDLLSGPWRGLYSVQPSADRSGARSCSSRFPVWLMGMMNVLNRTLLVDSRARCAPRPRIHDNRHYAQCPSMILSMCMAASRVNDSGIRMSVWRRACSARSTTIFWAGPTRR